LALKNIGILFVFKSHFYMWLFCAAKISIGFLQLRTLTRQIPSLYQFLADAPRLNLSGIG
jgi:hypothetical protein